MGSRLLVYKDPNQPIEARVEDLLSRMTLAEKVGQMAQIERSAANEVAIKDFGIGSILSAGGSAPKGGASATEWADMVDAFQNCAIQSRLGIPIIYGIDAVHGHNTLVGATIFPHNIGLGATRDAGLVEKIGAATAMELRASGIPYTFAPCVSVSRDPRWGRCYESFGEDTELVQSLTSIVAGLQGAPPESLPKGYPYVAGRHSVVACAKHFVGDGGTTGGINEGDTLSSYEELESVHVEPFVECVDKHVSSIMVSYTSWNGSKLHSHYFLITKVLKEQLGFKGFVISDLEGLDRLCYPKGSDYLYCITAAINAGIDMVMLPRRYEKFILDLIFLVEEGKVSMKRIDDAVRRILRVKFAAGLFDHPQADRSLCDVVGCSVHRELAREAVRKSLVLLKNGKDSNKPILPLDKNAKRVLVVGRHADDLGFQCGGWTISWHGGSGRTTKGTTIIEGLRAAVSEHTEIVYKPEISSLDMIQDTDFSYAIVVVGEVPYVEGAGDNSYLEIPLNGRRHIEATVSEKFPTLVIMISGRPLVVEPWLEKVDGLVVAWLPGTEGGGIVDVIFGGYEFEGKLPRTWFRKVDQLPMNVGDKKYDPLFPFGFGLKMELKKDDASTCSCH